jgi:hypothetical protein
MKSSERIDGFLNQGGLACSVRTKNGANLSLREVKPDIVYRRQLTEVLGESNAMNRTSHIQPKTSVKKLNFLLLLLSEPALAS